MKPKRLQKRVEAIAARAAPAVLGVAVEDLTTRQLWAFNGDRPFPLGAAARVPILAAIQAEQSAGRLLPSETIAVRDVDLSPPPSAVGQAWPGRQTWTVADLESLALHGDNTALDLLTQRVGGPGGVNGWLDVKRLGGVSVDRYRRQIETDAFDLASFRADWRTEAAWSRAIAEVPAQQRVDAGRRLQADARDTASPIGMVRLLEAFGDRALMDRPDANRLLGHDVGYLAAATPKGAQLIQAAGSSRPEQGTISISHAVAFMELKDGRRIAFAIFMNASPAKIEQREALIADVGRAVLEEF